MIEPNIKIEGHFKRNEFSEIQNFIEKMETLGFQNTEIECTGNMDTGYIFLETILLKKIK